MALQPSPGGRLRLQDGEPFVAEGQRDVTGVRVTDGGTREAPYIFLI